MNITGILFGLFTLLAIRLGLVRVILVFFVPSLLVASNLSAAALGILGMTTIWDGTELYRQEDRIRRGHARRTRTARWSRDESNP